MLRQASKVATAIKTVTPRRGLLQAVRVAIGPELAKAGLWNIPADDLEVIYHERQVIGVGRSAESKRALLDPFRQDETVPPDIRPYLRFIPEGGRVLDVGAGPISRLTGGHLKGRYTLTATDLLADQYRAMLCAYGHQTILCGIRYVSCPAERLASVLERDCFDFVTMHNALDHTTSPRAVVEQLCAVTKPGGVIVLSGKSREGTGEKWTGMHQHDLWLENDHVWRCGREGSGRQCLTDGLGLEYIAGQEPVDPHGMMVAVFRRSK